MAKSKSFDAAAESLAHVLPEPAEPNSSIAAFDPHAFAPAPGADLAAQVAGVMPTMTRVAPKTTTTVPAVVAEFAPLVTKPEAAGESMPSVLGKGTSVVSSAYSEARTSTHAATNAMETSLSAYVRGLAAWQDQILVTAKACAEEGFSHLKALHASRNPAELISLSGDFLRKSTDVFGAQSKAFLDLAQAVARETAAPLKAMGLPTAVR